MSSTRAPLKPFPVITNGSMAASITSSVTIIQNMTDISYDIRWSAGATPIGTMSVEVSNTYSIYPDGSVNNPGTWTSVTLSSTPSISGNTGNGFIDIADTGAYAIRLKYNRTSGTGTMNAIITAKGV